MSTHENGRPVGEPGGHGEKGSSRHTVADSTDISRYRRRCVAVRACRRTWQHLAAHGLAGELSRRVLDDIERGWSA